MWYTVFDSIPKPEYTILLIQKNDAKIMTGSRRITYNKLDPPILFAPVTPHPRRRLVCANPHTTRHKPPHHAPRSVSAPHCRDSRRATPDATGRHSTRHEQGHRKPGNATVHATAKDTASQGTPHHTLPRRTPQARERHTSRHGSSQLGPISGKVPSFSGPAGG